MSHSDGALCFLQRSLDPAHSGGEHRVGGARWTWLAQGVLQIEPESTGDLCGAILSVGVHGDETVPIRLLDRWLEDTWRREGPVTRPMLVILANPEAVKLGRRFVEHNMNRLFFPGAADSMAGEHRRAMVLMDRVREFAARHPGGLHFDMHSTIKASDQDRFAVIPVDCEAPATDELYDWLRQFSVDAWVRNISPAAAFSGFTARLGYRSATLELGRVSSLDEPIDRFLPLLPALDSLAAGKPDTGGEHPMAAFQVVDEILRPEGDFAVCLEDFVNFRALPAGTLIARGGGRSWRVEQDGDALLFLNPDVPPGHRVALIIRQR